MYYIHPYKLNGEIIFNVWSIKIGIYTLSWPKWWSVWAYNGIFNPPPVFEYANVYTLKLIHSNYTAKTET